MTERSCDLIGELLVGYADGELSDRDTERVAAHLAECPGCRSELGLLERSLEAAKAAWRESAAEAPMPGTRPVRPALRRVPAAACVAACIMLALLAAGSWLVWRNRPGSETAGNKVPPQVREGDSPIFPAGKLGQSPGKLGQSPSDSPAVAKEINIEAMIVREARAARLAVSVQLLASQPGLEEYRDQAERYLAETYGARTSVGASRDPTHDRGPAIQ